MVPVIKHHPEDFIVREQTTLVLTTEGRHTCFWLTKRNYNTLDALKTIAKALRVRTNAVGYAGLKDRHAHTTQLCSILGDYAHLLKQIKLSDITVDFAGYSDRPVSLGQLSSNSFTITVRNLECISSIITPEFFNLFGHQRLSDHNVDIGRLLLQRKFNEAVELAVLPTQQRQETLRTSGPIGVLRQLQKRILTLYIHSYQSWLFNETLTTVRKQEETIPPLLPLTGFGTEESELPAYMKKLMEQDNLHTRSFIFPEFPELSSEGGLRATMARAEKLTLTSPFPDEFFPGKKAVTVSFDLLPGCYATEFISQKF